MLEEYSNRDVLTTQEVMKILRISKNTLYKLLQSGEIPSIKIGSKYIIRKDKLIKYLS